MIAVPPPIPCLPPLLRSAAASLPRSIARLRDQRRAPVLWQGDQLGAAGPCQLSLRLRRTRCRTARRRLASRRADRAAAAPRRAAAKSGCWRRRSARLPATRELVWVAPPHPPYAPACRARPADRTLDLGAVDRRRGRCSLGRRAGAALGAAGAVLVVEPRGLAGHLAPPALGGAGRQHAAVRAAAVGLAGSSHRRRRCGWRSNPPPVQRLRVHLFKRRGPSLAQPLLLSLPHTGPRRPARASAARAIVIPTSAAEDVVAGTSPALAAA